MEKKQKIRELIEPILKEMNVNLFDCVYEKEDNMNFLRIFIEREDWSMDLDTCVEVSEKISLLLDEVSYLDDEYMLEVASPGVERELKNKNEYLKAVDKYILVKTNQKVNGEEEIHGQLIEITDKSLKLQLNFKGRIKVVEIDLENIKKANLSFKY